MDATYFGWLVGILGTICGIVFAYISYQKNKSADDKNDGKEGGMVLTELGYIKSGVDDIKRKQEKQDERHLEMVERVSMLEASSKSAHKRIDYIEEHLNVRSARE